VAELVRSRNLYGDALMRARRRKEMSLAAEIQWDLLPPQTFSDGRITVAGVLEPAYEIAGDSFDYARNGDTLHFAIIDAMGHGFEATMLASVAVGAYRHRRRAGDGLPGFYAAMDGIMAEQFGPDRFVTAQLGELDVESGRLRWLNAGHPAPLLARGGRVIATLDCSPTLPVGFGGAVAEIAEERLQPGDNLLFYTDGVIEARSSSGEFFGEGRLADLLERALHANLPAAETVRRLSHAILDHQGSPLQDDATTLLLTWHGASG
jgi:serine phosphatase RsbU (regulator of sigma subunit)